jgi:hypothetical protein
MQIPLVLRIIETKSLADPGLEAARRPQGFQPEVKREAHRCQVPQKPEILGDKLRNSSSRIFKRGTKISSADIFKVVKILYQ